MGNVKFDNTTYSHDALEKKYNHFFAPAFEVLIDETNLEQESIAISNMKVQTSIEAKADSFSFTVDNAFDPVKREFLWLDRFFAVGKYIEIKLGYIDKLVTVFYGLITSVELDYPASQIPNITVSGMDISFLMMKGVHSNSWKDKKDSDVIKRLASKYGLNSVVDDTAEKKPIIEQIDMTDFQFISAKAKENNYDFFVIGKSLYFRKPKKNTSPVITLMYGKNLMSYSTDVNIANQVSQVIVRSLDGENSDPIEAKSMQIDVLGTNTKTGKDIMKSLADYTKEYVYTNVSSQQEAQKLADSLMNERAMDLVTGSGQCIGIPEIRAGRYIKLDGLGKKFDQLLYLTSVEHKINDAGYITKFEVRGNAI